MPQVREDFAGMEAGAMWDDAKFFLPHKDDFEKMAMVNTSIDHIVKAGVFAAGQLAQAWKWIRA